MKAKVALVYDRVNTPYGGAEKLLLSLHELYPQAPLYTSLYDRRSAPWADVFEVRPSFLNKIPFLKTKHRLMASLMPIAFESFDFSEFDLVISITSAEAKGIITLPQTTHVCYLLTPPRYLYSHRNFYLQTKLVFKIPILGFLARKLLDYLVFWDQMAVHRPDRIIPISKIIQKRAQKYYGLKIEKPIYPTIVNPLELEKNSPPPKKEKYFLIISRLVSYKKIDLAIKACQQLNKKLIIVGQGPEKENLEELITKPSLIKLVGSATQKELNQLYKNCLALLMIGEEDFGIVALEAWAFGKPVIINQKSGANELLIPKKTGLSLKRIDLQGIKTALLEVEQHHWQPAIIKTQARKYNQVEFKKQFARALKNALQQI
jgi:glycosyltransferase involved in cell wall biosynthesis